MMGPVLLVCAITNVICSIVHFQYGDYVMGTILLVVAIWGFILAKRRI